MYRGDECNHKYIYSRNPFCGSAVWPDGAWPRIARGETEKESEYS